LRPVSSRIDEIAEILQDLGASPTFAPLPRARFFSRG